MQQSFAVWRKFHEHLAVILISEPTSQGALVNETIYKLHSTVMAKAELPGERSYSRTSAPGQALDRQKKLMLLGFDTFGTGRFLAEVQELTDSVPELSEPPKTRF
jgi:hypothetical protein